MGLVDTLLVVVRSLVVPRGSLAVENLALRQQLAVLKRSVKRPRLRRRDRFFWAWLCRIWTDGARSTSLNGPTNGGIETWAGHRERNYQHSASGNARQDTVFARRCTRQYCGDVRPDESGITSVHTVRHATFFSETIDSSLLPS